MKQLLAKFEGEYESEVLYSSLGNKYLEGFIIRGKSLAVIDDTVASQKVNGAIEVDLNLFLEKKPSPERVDHEAEEQFIYHTDKAYENFAIGLEVHDDLEGIYINEMDFDKADQLADNFVDDLLEGVEKKNRTPQVYHRLFGTNTADGVVNCVPEILQDLSTVYFVKGRAGTGKSTFMKHISQACQQHGFDVELYYCSFDPNSIDMVLVRDLDFCIFDSTDPHEFFPTRDGEKIIDLYERCVTSGTDEKFATEINHLNNTYKSYMKQGIHHLKEAGAYLEKTERQYTFTEEDTQNMVDFIWRDVIQ